MVFYRGPLLEKFNTDRLGKKVYCDVIVNVGGVKFHGHRFLLGIVSGYFDRLFGNNFKESACTEINLQSPYGIDFTSATMDIVLDFIYTENALFTNDNIYDVLMVANYLDIPSLENACIDFLGSLLSKKTWLNISHVANQVDSQSLKQACKDFFVNNLKLGLNYTEMIFVEFLSLLSGSHKDLSNQDILQAVLSWVKFQGHERKKHLNELLSFVDFKVFNSDFINCELFMEPLIAESQDIMQSITEVLNTRRLLIICGESDDASQSVVKYNPANNKITSCLHSPIPCCAPAVASYGSKCIIAGGNGNTSNIMILDTETDSWTVHNSVLQFSRFSAGGCFVKNNFFLIGGFNSDMDCLSSIEVFSVSDLGTLESCHDNPQDLELTHARAGHAVVVRDTELFIIGGTDDGMFVPSEMLNLMNKQSMELPSMIDQRTSFAAVLLEDHIIAIGGYGTEDKLCSVESFCISGDFENQKWKALPPMNTKRYGHCACVFDGKIFVIGGNVDSVEIYDPISCSWSMHESPDIGRKYSAVIVV